MNIYFSCSSLSFYPEEFKKDYEKSGSWPPDGILVEYKTFKEFALNPKPAGKKLGSLNGHPVWIIDSLAETKDTTLERQWRNLELQRADIELYKVQDSDLKSVGTVGDWRSYRKSLRAWPEHIAFPKIEFRPKAPDFKE